MKTCFQILQGSLDFVGWLAPAYRDRCNQSLRDHERKRRIKYKSLLSGHSDNLLNSYDDAIISQAYHVFEVIDPEQF